jgi:hypothetical protein
LRRLRDLGGWILLPVLVPIGMFWSALAGSRSLAPEDGYRAYLPLHMVAARIWRTGHIPVWNSFEFSGYPMLAFAQTGVLYPPNFLMVAFPSIRAYAVLVVLNFVVAGVGAYLLARRLTGDNVAAAVAASAFGLSGFFFAHIGHHALVASAAWIPWCFYGFELVLDRLSAARLLLASSAVAFTLLAGHPQTWSVLLAALGLYAVVLALGDRPRAWRPVGIAALIVVVAALLAAAQLLPTAAIVDESARADVDYYTATTYSMGPSDLPLLLFPLAFGGGAGPPFDEAFHGEWGLVELAGYPTVVGLVLAAAGLWAVRRHRRVIAFAVVGLLAVLVALGDSTPFGTLVYRVPPYGQFRSWARYLVFFDLVVAVLAAYGVVQLRSEDEAERRKARLAVAWAAGTVAVLAVAFQFIGPVRDHLIDGTGRTLAFAVPVVAAVGAAVWALIARPRRRVGAGLVVLIVADALFFGWFTAWRAGPDHDFVERQLSADVLPTYGGIPNDARGVDRYLFLGEDVTKMPEFVATTDVKGMYSANGYDPLAPRRYLALVAGMTSFGGTVDPAAAWNPEGHLLDLLRVTLVLSENKLSRHIKGVGILGAGTRVRGTGVTRFEYRPRLPEAYLVGEVLRASAADIHDAVTGASPFAPADQVLVDQHCAACASLRRAGPAGRATVTHRRPGSLALEVDASRAAMVVVSEGWFPGWRAKVDGQATDVTRVNGMLNGVVVGPGEHRVELTYRAPGLRVGAIVSVATIVALLVALALPAPLPHGRRTAWHRRLRGNVDQ